MTTDPFSTVATELPRDRYGRPLITPPDGGDPVAYQRVTTFVGALEDTYHLSVWSQTMVVLGMARRQDLVLAASAITDPKDQFQKRTLKGLAKQAIDASGGGAAAGIGTALHAFSERADEGTLNLDDVPEAYRADMEAYSKVTRIFKPLDMEGFCVVDNLRVGGSYDRIYVVDAAGLADYEAEHGELYYPDASKVQVGDTFIGDLKTGSNVDFGMGKIAQQLAVYANAEKYDHTLGTRSPLPGNPSKKWGVVIHLPAGSGAARLLWVDLAAGWEAATTLSVGVHAYRKRRDLAKEFASARVAPTLAPNLVEQIKAAPSYEALKALYAANSERWTPGLTALAKDRTAELKAAA